MRAGQERAFADELEVTPRQQRIARHPVLGNEEGVARELWLEALVDRVSAHALRGRLIDIVSRQLVLIVCPHLKDTGAVHVTRGQHAPAEDTDLALAAWHIRFGVEGQATDRLPFNVDGGILIFYVT